MSTFVGHTIDCDSLRATQHLRKAPAIWRALLEGRWSLVDYFEHDGKRYVLAQENAPDTSGPPRLSKREQQVTELAALGHSNKAIAYELGIAHATVRVLISRAMAKCGARGRAELVARMSRPST